MHLLVFNCHEAWVYQLHALDRALDIVVGLDGHHASGWDDRMRPLPPRSRLLSLGQARQEARSYDAVICHNLTDLLESTGIEGPRLLVVHSTFEGRKATEGADVPLDQLRAKIRQYLALVGGHAIAVSEMKCVEGFPDQVVTAGVDPDDYPAWRGDLAAGLRIANQVGQKRLVLAWDLHEAAFAGLPVTLIGHNPDLPGVAPARDWDDLKAQLARHRFFIHTADPRYEDGFNMAMLEAMAAGLPVIGNRHPSSPIRHGIDGFLADEPSELRTHAERLLGDRDLAARLGAAARETAARRFHSRRFARSLHQAIERSRREGKEGGKRPHNRVTGGNEGATNARTSSPGRGSKSIAPAQPTPTHVSTRKLWL